MIFTLDIENKENYLSIFRLMVSKVMAEENYKFDDIEDTKVAVGEMALVAHAINKDRVKMDIKFKEKSMIMISSSSSTAFATTIGPVFSVTL